MKRKKGTETRLGYGGKEWEKKKRGLRVKQENPESLRESIKECKDQDEVQSQAWAKVTSLNYFVSSQDKSKNLTLNDAQIGCPCDMDDFLIF